MAEDLHQPPPPPPMRLMNFVSQDQLEESKRSRGERVEDGTAQRDRPLFEILKENKDKRDAEFNERFKHRPPKALDEDETEFLDKLEMATVEAQSRVIHETKEIPPVSAVQQEKRAVGKKNTPVQPLGMIIKVKPPAKKAKVDPSLGSQSGVASKMSAGVQKCFSPGKRYSDGEKPKEPQKISVDNEDIPNVRKTGLV